MTPVAALVNFARVVPEGLLVFFPSSSALQAAHTAWGGSSSSSSSSSSGGEGPLVGGAMRLA